MLAKLYSTISAQEGADLIPNVYLGGALEANDSFVLKNSKTTKMRPIESVGDAILMRGIRGLDCNYVGHGNSAMFTAFTDEQKEEIQIGRFKGMALGMCWNIGGKIYRIVGFDWFCGVGNGGTQTYPPETPDDVTIPHHVVVYCNRMGSAAFNANRTQSNLLYKDTWIKEQMEPGGIFFNIAAGAFGADWICKHRELLCDSADSVSGKPLHFKFTDSYMDLPSLYQYNHDWYSSDWSHYEESWCPTFPGFLVCPYYYTWNGPGAQMTRTKDGVDRVLTLNPYNTIYKAEIRQEIPFGVYFLLGKFKES